MFLFISTFMVFQKVTWKRKFSHRNCAKTAVANAADLSYREKWQNAVLCSKVFSAFRDTFTIIVGLLSCAGKSSWLRTLSTSTVKVFPLSSSVLCLRQTAYLVLHNSEYGQPVNLIREKNQLDLQLESRRLSANTSFCKAIHFHEAFRY